MTRPLTEQDTIFDGFAHRNFDPESDGWINEQPSMMDYQCVLQATETLKLFNELSKAKRQIWELEQELKLWKR